MTLDKIAGGSNNIICLIINHLNVMHTAHPLYICDILYFKCYYTNKCIFSNIPAGNHLEFHKYLLRLMFV